jgi:hypothetical protein
MNGLTGRRRGLLPPLLALLCLLVTSAPAAAITQTGTVTVTAILAPQIVVTPSGEATLIRTLQINANKKEWYYVYAMNGGNARTEGKITVLSNRTWNGQLSVVQTAGDKKKMDLASGVLHYSTTMPATFAEAAATPVLGTTPITLGMSNNPAGVAVFTHYLLLHVSQGSGGTVFGATLTYSAGQVSSVASATAQVTIAFPGL